jgi:predicted RNA binding protein YcfA (HicA-like mRNA interferase family)
MKGANDTRKTAITTVPSFATRDMQPGQVSDIEAETELIKTMP